MIFVLFLGRDGWVGGYLMLPPHEGKIRRRFGGSGAGVLPRTSAQSNLHHVWDWELRWDGMGHDNSALNSVKCLNCGAG